VADDYRALIFQPRPHVAFGFGAHVCLGANLARMEARVPFEELLRVFPDFQVTGPAVRGKSTLVAIVEQLPAVFGTRAHAGQGRDASNVSPQAGGPPGQSTLATGGSSPLAAPRTRSRISYIL